MLVSSFGKTKTATVTCKINWQILLKDDHYSLSYMFGGKKHNKEELAKHFEGGTVYQAFLSALDYHRWHSPVDGVIEDIYAIDGTYYLDQSEFIPMTKDLRITANPS